RLGLHREGTHAEGAVRGDAEDRQQFGRVLGRAIPDQRPGTGGEVGVVKRLQVAGVHLGLVDDRQAAFLIATLFAAECLPEPVETSHAQTSSELDEYIHPTLTHTTWFPGGRLPF